MKKLYAVLAAAAVAAMALIYLSWDPFEQEWGILPATWSKKTVEITEISEEPFTLGMIKGRWVLYLYYPNATKSLELAIDENGTVTGRPEDLGDMGVMALSADGSLEVKSGSLSLKGSMDETREHLDGMAIVKDASSPIPFSCFKIGMSPAALETP